MIDYHLHTEFCRHAEGKPIEYCEYAVKNGIKEVGFADHFPINIQPSNSIDIKTITMREDEITQYLTTLTELKEKIKDLTIRRAFEVDYYIKENLFFNKYSKLYDELDYIICSVHFIQGLGFDQEEYINLTRDYGVKKVWGDYFDNMEAAIKECRKYIDIIGHVDLPKKFLNVIPDGLFGRMRELLKIIKDNELVVEVNTSGLDKPIKEQYPSEKVLDIIKEMKIEITMGSDAHKPSEVGRYFPEVAGLLRSKGFTRLIKFDQHKKEYYNL